MNKGKEIAQVGAITTELIRSLNKTQRISSV